MYLLETRYPQSTSRGSGSIQPPTCLAKFHLGINGAYRLWDLAKGHRNATSAFLLSFYLIKEIQFEQWVGWTPEEFTKFKTFGLTRCIYSSIGRPIDGRATLLVDLDHSKPILQKTIVHIYICCDIDHYPIKPYNPKPSSWHLCFDWCASPPLHWLRWHRTPMLWA